MAALRQVVYDYRRRNRSEDVLEKKVGDTTIKFVNPNQNQQSPEAFALMQRFGLSPDAFHLANHYRRVA